MIQTRTQTHYLDNETQVCNQLNALIHSGGSDNLRICEVYQWCMDNYQFIHMRESLHKVVDNKARELMANPACSSRTCTVLRKWLEFYARK